MVSLVCKINIRECINPLSLLTHCCQEDKVIVTQERSSVLSELLIEYKTQHHFQNSALFSVVDNVETLLCIMSFSESKFLSAVY